MEQVNYAYIARTNIYFATIFKNMPNMALAASVKLETENRAEGQGLNTRKTVGKHLGILSIKHWMKIYRSSTVGGAD